ncbi:MAG: hypothetical protein GX118_01315 [Arcobacter butzleri]|nr:hypothetical protein [Aliarcobacter butzleri]
MVKNIDNTYKQLMALLSIFVIGVLFVVIVNFVFSKFINDLEKQTIKHSSKITISKFIAEDIQNLRALFFEMATTSSNNRIINVIETEIDKIISDIENSLDILENGGILIREIRLNIVKHDKIKQEIVYQKIKDDDISLDIIDIKPKIEEFLELKEKLISLIKIRQQALSSNDMQEFSASIRELQLFHRTIPAFFIRFAENNSRILYEGEQRLLELNKEIESKKQIYIYIEIYLIILILILILWLGSLIAKNINKNHQNLAVLNKELNSSLQELEYQKRFARSILDAQSNIVLVTSGMQIIDANRAMFKFLNQFRNLDDFLKVSDCICDFFVSFEKDQRYILNKNYGQHNWAEYVYNNPQKSHRVAMMKNDKVYHFKLKIDRQVFENNEQILVVSLNDITKEVEIQKSLQSLNANLEYLVKEKTKELKELNENLKQKIIIEVEKNRKKDQQMIQQSRYAALGEMIGNIAHQWRQPLSAISTTSSGMIVQIELGLANNEEIKKSYEDIMYYVSFLTQTIEDFRGFFRKDQTKEPFNVISALDSTLKIISASYKDHSIKVFSHYASNNIQVVGNSSELSQVFLNILNNAKDIMIEKLKDNRKIFITILLKEDEAQIEIQDNGGGVPDTIIEKVFDPYFTTKHKSQGTGIGLYMSKDIVEKKLSDFLSVRNREVVLGDQLFNGACFIITLPIYKA